MHANCKKFEQQNEKIITTVNHHFFPELLLKHFCVVKIILNLKKILYLKFLLKMA